MIDISNAKKEFKKLLDKYNSKEKPGFNLKITHTYHVMENAKKIACRLELSEEDIELAELIALLHDIGRFEELMKYDKFDSVNNDHAQVGIKMLFDDNLIRKFIKTEEHDEIIKKAILNHNKLRIEDKLEKRSLLHAKIIRDADKLDNYRVKKEEKIESIFPNIVKTKEQLEHSKISKNVYQSILNKQCVDIHDRKTPLDYWCCVLAFLFDLNFKESFKIMKDNNYINICIDRLNYKNKDSKDKMNNIRNIMNTYIEEKIKE